MIYKKIKRSNKSPQKTKEIRDMRNNQRKHGPKGI